MLKQALAILTLAAGPLAASTPALAEAPDFNGTWTVQLVTETGVCSGSSSYTVAIQDGQVRLASAGGSASITGQIGADGSVGLVCSKDRPAARPRAGFAQAQAQAPGRRPRCARAAGPPSAAPPSPLRPSEPPR